MAKQVVPHVIRASSHPFQPDFLNYDVYDLNDLEAGAHPSEEVCSNVTTIPTTITFAGAEAICIADATAKGLYP